MSSFFPSMGAEFPPSFLRLDCLLRMGFAIGLILLRGLKNELYTFFSGSGITLTSVQSELRCQKCCSVPGGHKGGLSCTGLPPAENLFSFITRSSLWHADSGTSAIQ